MNTATPDPATPTKTPMHLILGDGVVGQAVADELTKARVPHALASRSPAAHPSPHRRVDALDRHALIVATAGVTHLYVTLGLRYDLRTWQRDWPVIVANVIAAARVQQLRVVFFDNVYAYGPTPLRVPMTEEHPQQPPSRKGAVRKATTTTTSSRARSSCAATPTSRSRLMRAASRRWSSRCAPRRALRLRRAPRDRVTPSAPNARPTRHRSCRCRAQGRSL